MKKILILLLLVSCSKPDCKEQIDQVTKQYLNSLQLIGDSSSAGIELTRQYNNKINQINSNCN
jgi:hypothetical protein